MKVTVYFQGICTHIVPQGEASTEVRVVLVDAQFGLFANGGHIPPHQATIHLAPKFIADAPPAIPGLAPKRAEFLPSLWIMQGVELEILTPGSTANALRFEPSYFLLPSLSAIARDNQITAPLELSRRVVDEGAAPCVFIIRNGTLDALQHREAVHGKLMVEADEPVQLRVTRFWDRHESIITLQRSATGEEPMIIVGNTGVDDDKEIDFVLHYGVTTFSPPQPLTLPAIPVREATPEELKMLGASTEPNAGMTITHGCSNSVYP